EIDDAARSAAAAQAGPYPGTSRTSRNVQKPGPVNAGRRDINGPARSAAAAAGVAGRAGVPNGSIIIDGPAQGGASTADNTDREIAAAVPAHSPVPPLLAPPPPPAP